MDITTTSKVLAPEDISPGDYVAPLSLLCEFVDIYRSCRDGPPDLCRVTFLPPAFTPYHVVGVCLPFVLVEDAAGVSTTLDVRRVSLARLDEDFAQAAMKRARRQVKA